MKIMNYIVSLCCAILLFAACEDDEELVLKSAVSFKESTVTVSENADYIDIPLALTSELKGSARVYLEGDAENVADIAHVIFPSYVDIESGAVRGNIRVVINDNGATNENVVLKLRIVKTEGVEIATANTECTLTITDNDVKQEVSVAFDTVRIEAGENVGVFEVPIIVEGILSDSITIQFAANDGTANESDYVLKSNKVVIRQGESWGVVKVEITDKVAEEVDRDFNLIILSVDDHVADEELATVDAERAECNVTIKKVIREIGFVADQVYLDESDAMKEITTDFGIQLTAPLKEDIIVVVGPKGDVASADYYKLKTKTLTIRSGELTAFTEAIAVDDTIGISRYCDLEIKEAKLVSGGEVVISANNSSTIVIENDDTSVGFFAAKIGAISGRVKAPVAFKVDGVRDAKTTISYEVIQSENLKEGVHFLYDKKDVVFLPGQVVASVQLIILPAFEGGNIPVQITGVRSSRQEVYFNGDLSQSEIFWTGETQLDLTKIAKVTYTNTEELTGESNGANGRAIHLIDGKDDTFWHSMWSNANGEHREDPETEKPLVEIRLDGEYLVSSCQVLKRVVDPPNKLAYVEVSADKVKWTKIYSTIDIQMPAEMIPVRYIKVSTEEQFAKILELKLWAANLEAEE